MVHRHRQPVHHSPPASHDIHRQGDLERRRVDQGPRAYREGHAYHLPLGSKEAMGTIRIPGVRHVHARQRPQPVPGPLLSFCRRASRRSMEDVRLPGPNHQRPGRHTPPLALAYALPSCPRWQVERLCQDELVPLPRHLSLHVLRVSGRLSRSCRHRSGICIRAHRVCRPSCRFPWTQLPEDMANSERSRYSPDQQVLVDPYPQEPSRVCRPRSR